MTQEEFLTIKAFDHLYIDGRQKIWVMDTDTDPLSEYFGSARYYDENEYVRRVHYDRLEFELSDFEKNLEKLAEEFVNDGYRGSDYTIRIRKDALKEGFKAGYRNCYKNQAKSI